MIENCTDSAKPASRLPVSIRRSVERAIMDASAPIGMSTHSGQIRADASHVTYLLMLIDTLEREAAERTEHVRTPERICEWVDGPHGGRKTACGIFGFTPASNYCGNCGEKVVVKPYISSTKEAA